MKNQASGLLFELFGDPSQVWNDIENNVAIATI